MEKENVKLEKFMGDCYIPYSHSTQIQNEVVLKLTLSFHPEPQYTLESSTECKSCWQPPATHSGWMEGVDGLAVAPCKWLGMHQG